MQRRHERFRVIKYRFVLKAHEDAVVINGGVSLDCFQPVAIFEHRVRYRPALDIRRPGDQCGSIPESDGFPVPLRDLLHMLPPNHDLAQEIGGDAGQELDVVYVHRELEVPALRCL
jgi:hypothetical protein